jgi:opacity protein-like surface antigen
MAWNIRALLVIAMFVAAPAAAQETRAWPERAFIAIDVPFQPLANDFSESLRFPDAVRRTENVSFAADYPTARGVLFDAGAGVRVTNAMGIGATVSWVQRSTTGAFDLTVPNPTTANRPLNLTGSVSGLRRRELGIHVQTIYARALGKRSRLMVSGGPSIFTTTQDVVRSIEFDIPPGATSLTFGQAQVAGVTKSAIGFNAGVDVSWALTSHVGVGAITRYSRATVTLDPGSASGVSRAIELHAGGLHVGGGVRLLF